MAVLILGAMALEACEVQAPVTAKAHLETTQPQPIKEDIFEKFRSRASAGEIEEYEVLRLSGHREDRTHALERVLFKLTDKELFGIGITQAGEEGALDWVVAWTKDAGELSDAVRRALTKAGIPFFGSCGHGRAGWYVSRTQFFKAREAILKEVSVFPPDEKVVTPRCPMESEVH